MTYHVSVLKQDGPLHREARQPPTLAKPGDPASQAKCDAIELLLIGQIAADTPSTPWNWLGRPAGQAAESRRLVSRDGLIKIAGQAFQVSTCLTGRIVTIRLHRDLMHVPARHTV